MLNQNLKDTDGALNTSEEVEVFPGRFERRYFLKGSVCSIAAAAVLNALGRTTLSQQPDKTLLTSTADLAWDDFIKTAIPAAQKLIAEPDFSIDE